MACNYNQRPSNRWHWRILRSSFRDIDFISFRSFAIPYQPPVLGMFYPKTRLFVCPFAPYPFKYFFTTMSKSDSSHIFCSISFLFKHTLSRMCEVSRVLMQYLDRSPSPKTPMTSPHSSSTSGSCWLRLIRQYHQSFFLFRIYEAESASRFHIWALGLSCLRLNLVSRFPFQGWILALC